MQLVPIPDSAWVSILRDAWRRSEPKRILGWRTTTYGGMDALPVHIWGLAGEYAVGVILGLDYDTGVHPTDGTSDFTLSNGESVEVKTRTRHGWSYVPSRGHKGLGDWLALVYPQESNNGAYTRLAAHLSNSTYEVTNSGEIQDSSVRMQTNSPSGGILHCNPQVLCVVGFASRDTFDKEARPLPKLNNQLGLAPKWFVDETFTTMPSAK